MEFFILIFAILGFGILSSLAKSGGGDSQSPQKPASPRPAGGAGTVRRAAPAAPRRALSGQGEEDARKFVEQLKRKNREREISSPARQQPARGGAFDSPAPAAPAEPAPHRKGKYYSERNPAAERLSALEREIARLREEGELALKRAREAAARRDAPAQPAPEAPRAAAFSRPFFSGKADLKRAFVASEILRPPLSMRK